jgi:formiminotetrahydrofolate cyclodeaminase
MTDKLIALRAGSLLRKFGSGHAVPGSGSAAALMGLLASQLLITVATLTQKKVKRRSDITQVEYLKNEIKDTFEPRLKVLFQLDSDIFENVIDLRTKKNIEPDQRKKERLADLALEELKKATIIPIEISEICLKLVDCGSAMFDMGYKAVRGDSGAAMSVALAGAMSGVFIVDLNLKSFRGGTWAVNTKIKLISLHQDIQDRHNTIYSKLVDIPFTSPDNDDLPLFA